MKKEPNCFSYNMYFVPLTNISSYPFPFHFCHYLLSFRFYIARRISKINIQLITKITKKRNATTYESGFIYSDIL